MAKVHKYLLAAICMGVWKEVWREVGFGSFDSPRPQTWWDCRKELSNNRNGWWQLILGFVEVSLLLLLPKVATAGKSVWMVHLLGSELGSLLCHENPYCPLRPLPSFNSNLAVKQSTLPSFCNLPSGSWRHISKLLYMDEVYKTCSYSRLVIFTNWNSSTFQQSAPIFHFVQVIQVPLDQVR